MKKITYLCTLAIAFCAGYFISQKINQESITFLEESNTLKYEILMLQDEALQKVDTIMSNNDIYDIDGSDIMSDYLTIRCKLDSIYNANR